jgi:AcrR family transcriptional regulator
MVRKKASGCIVRRKRQIQTAAIGVFIQKGFEKATIKEIARVANLAEGTIYNYYRNKRDLVISAIGDYFVTQQLIGIMNTTDTDDYDLMQILFEDRLSKSIKNGNLFMLLLSELQRDPVLKDQYWEQVIKPLFQVLAIYLKNGMRDCRFYQRNIDITERALGGMAIGLSILYQVEGENGPLHQIPLQQVAKEVSQVILDGIRNK